MMGSRRLDGLMARLDDGGEHTAERDPRAKHYQPVPPVRVSRWYTAERDRDLAHISARSPGDLDPILPSEIAHSLGGATYAFIGFWRRTARSISIATYSPSACAFAAVRS